MDNAKHITWTEIDAALDGMGGTAALVPFIEAMVMTMGGSLPPEWKAALGQIAADKPEISITLVVGGERAALKIAP